MAKKIEKKPNNATNKIPPQNIEAEQALLGSILLDKDAIIKISDLIVASDFYQPSHEIIFEAMIDLFNKRQPIDLVTLTNELENKKQLKEIGGASYLASLANSVPTSAHIINYAKIVKEKSTLRSLINAASEISALGFGGGLELELILDRAEQTLFGVSQKNLKQSFIPLKDILTETFERIDRLHKEKGNIKGLPTGFSDLDFILGGLQPSDMIVVAARPSMGKTSFVLNIAEHIAVKKKIPVAIFSLEMSKEQIVDRFISMTSGIEAWKLRTGNFSDEDFQKFGQAMAELAEAPIFIDDTASMSIMEMRTKARRLHAESPLGLLIVDYLQLMEGRNPENRVQEISEISRSLKALARELSVPVLAVSQLSRAVETRPSHIPQLADLRESGSIEQDADVVIFIYREDYYDKDSMRRNIADIMVKKHRNGPTGEIELYFVAEKMKFQNMEVQRADFEPIVEA